MASAPPQRPEDVDPAEGGEPRAGTVITIVVVFAALSTFITCVRVYTRARILRMFSRDDVAIICAQVRVPRVAKAEAENRWPSVLDGPDGC